MIFIYYHNPRKNNHSVLVMFFTEFTITHKKYLGVYQ